MLEVGRKIGFYSIEVVKGDEVLNPALFVKLVEFISQLTEEDRIQDLERDKKIHLIGSYQEQNGLHYCVMKSAKYYHRPPLINRTDASERENPKLKDEGEREPTHICFKIVDDEVLMVKEERRSGISIGALVKYLKHFGKQFNQANGNKRKRLPFNLLCSVVPHQNFIDQVGDLYRVEMGELYMSKQILGSELLNASERITEVRQEVALQVKPVTGGNLTSFVVDAYRNWRDSTAGEQSRIKRIRVRGKTSDNVGVLLDTDIIKKVETVSLPAYEDTGLVVEQEMLLYLGGLLRDEI